MPSLLAQCFNEVYIVIKRSIDTAVRVPKEMMMKKNGHAPSSIGQPAVGVGHEGDKVGLGAVGGQREARIARRRQVEDARV